jgi:hypothetical protein
MKRISVEDELPEQGRLVKIYAKMECIMSGDGHNVVDQITVTRKARFFEDKIGFLVNVDSGGEKQEVTHWEYLDETN